MRVSSLRYRGIVACGREVSRGREATFEREASCGCDLGCLSERANIVIQRACYMILFRSDQRFRCNELVCDSGKWA